MTQNIIDPNQQDDHDDEARNETEQAEHITPYAEHPDAVLFGFDPDQRAESAEKLFFSALQTLRDSLSPDEYNTVVESTLQDLLKAFCEMQIVARRHKADMELLAVLHDYAVTERNNLRIRVKTLEAQYQSMAGIIEATLGHLIKTIKDH